MSEKNRVERDIALVFDFLRYAVDHPEILNDIPDGAEVEFIGSDIVTTEPAEERPSDGKKRAIFMTKRVFEPGPVC